jgi:hypothetical protein
VLLIAPTIAPTAAQEPPSNVFVSGTHGTPLDISAYGSQFEALAAYSRDIVMNVSAQNFTNAQTDLARYNAVADQVEAFNGTSTDQVTVLNGIKASQADLAQLVVESQHFNALSARQATLVTSSPFSDESTNNTLDMQQIVTDLGTIRADLDTRTRDIAGVLAPYGVQFATSGETNGSFNSYMSDVSSRLANVTNLVFRNTTISTQIDRSITQYGDTIRFAGMVRTDQGGVSNVPVTVFVDNQTAAFVQTNATGAYNYTYAVEDIGAGTHIASASFDPQGVAYKGATSGPVRFSVRETSVNNTLEFDYGSLTLLNKIVFYGTVTTDNGPVRNAPIVFFVNGNAQVITQTDENGTYEVAYSMGLPDFLRSLVTSQAPGFYTILEPGDRPLSSAQSATLTSPVLGTELATLAGSVVGGYVIIAAVALLVATPPLYVRRRRKQSARGAETLSTLAVEPLVAPEAPIAEPVSTPEVETAGELRWTPTGELASTLPLTTPAVEPAIAPEAPIAEPVSAPTPAPGGAPVLGSEVELPDVIKNARGMFDACSGEKAIMSLHDAMISLLVSTRGVALTTSMTNWEKFATIESAVPSARRPARTLTYADELARYSGMPVSRRMLDTAIAALESIGALNDSERAAQR